MTSIKVTKSDTAGGIEIARRKKHDLIIAKGGGTCSVYVMFTPHWDGRGRPAHDSSPFCECILTEKQWQTLRNKIGCFMTACMKKNQAQ